jgi:Delta7-sterol 5-desaturase
MDVVLELLDEYVFDNLYAKYLPSSVPSPPPPPPLTFAKSTWLSLISSLPIHISSGTITPANTTLHTPSALPTSAWSREYLPRQTLSLVVVTTIGIHLLYFLFAGLSYRFIFNHDMMRHPRFLPNQVCGTGNLVFVSLI